MSWSFLKKSNYLTHSLQSTHIETGSNLPTQILRRTNESLNIINYTEDGSLTVIRKLNPNKAHGHDQISIRMLQICDKAI